MEKKYQEYLQSLQVGDPVIMKIGRDTIKKGKVLRITTKAIITSNGEDIESEIQFDLNGHTDSKNYFNSKIINPVELEELKKNLKEKEIKKQVEDFGKKISNLNLEQFRQLVEAYNAIVSGTYKS